MNLEKACDVIVVGAGHAGVEASMAAARMGLNTVVVTTNLNRIAYMSCNPAIGGLAKGHIVREVDVLGGVMGFATDASCIQFKRLNASKGPAVRGSRAQCDKDRYSSFVTDLLKRQENLRLVEGEVTRLIVEKDICYGIVLGDGSEIRSKAVIITTGTFMNGVMHVGMQTSSGGRVGDRASIGLSDQLREFGFDVQRLKTGTPARLLRDSIDWTKTTPQAGDTAFFPFSLRSPVGPQLPQVLCYLSYTNEQTHDVIRKNLDKSPMYCGRIEGRGPRYCPSIEDKVTRFPEKIAHQTFLEPEGLNTDLIYLQGISTSLPADVQDQFLRTIPGLENVKVARYGYAVEYDFVEPTQIRHTLETRKISGLYLAGQINGTSGYEEAAGQGLIAGVNAAAKILDHRELVLGRDQAYIGVLVDDLVTKGTVEPYRMFTSRAEHRLVLREDNTTDRLHETAKDFGLADNATSHKINATHNKRSELRARLKAVSVFPNPESQARLKALGTAELGKPATLEILLKRPELSFESLRVFDSELENDPNVIEPVEIAIKYDGYIKRQEELIRQVQRMEEMRLSEDVEFTKIRGLSAEEVEKLSRVKPRTLGQASRISGVTPTAIQALMIFLKSRNSAQEPGRERQRQSKASRNRGALENSGVVS